jgi:threonine synthase
MGADSSTVRPVAFFMNLRCSWCQKIYPFAGRAWRCSCGHLFDLDRQFIFKPRKIIKSDFSLWRYSAMLPDIDRKHWVSLGEGWTPLVSAQINGIAIYCKLEYLAPTGSFKDRGMTVLVSALKAHQIQSVVEDSSGNAAASLAAYCARAGIQSIIFVPAHASPAKLAQIQIFGAELRRIDGPREASAQAAQQAADASYYASHVYNPLMIEGTKTFAYELWEQLGERAPDAIIFPVGHGSLLRGSNKAFMELRATGVIKKIPAHYAVQASAVAPLRRAWNENFLESSSAMNTEMSEPTFFSTTWEKTSAEGIAVAKPVHWRSILQIVRSTGGTLLSVSEIEILEAHKSLAKQGLFVEPTAAVSVAGIRQLREKIDPTDTVIVPLTGNGLKSSIQL